MGDLTIISYIGRKNGHKIPVILPNHNRRSDGLAATKSRLSQMAVKTSSHEERWSAINTSLRLKNNNHKAFRNIYFLERLGLTVHSAPEGVFTSSLFWVGSLSLLSSSSFFPLLLLIWAFLLREECSVWDGSNGIHHREGTGENTRARCSLSLFDSVEIPPQISYLSKSNASLGFEWHATRLKWPAGEGIVWGWEDAGGAEADKGVAACELDSFISLTFLYKNFIWNLNWLLFELYTLSNLSFVQEQNMYVILFLIHVFICFLFVLSKRWRLVFKVAWCHQHFFW